MSNTNTLRVSTSGQGFGQVRKRTISRSKWSTEVNTFVDLFASVMRQTAAPRCARYKYLTYIRKQLLNRGSGFLAQCRPYPVYGLRVLGNDVLAERGTDKMFLDVRMKRNADGIEFPIFMGWYWNRLWSLRKVKYPSKSESLEVSRILSVLSFSKFYLKDSNNGRRRAMNDYTNRIETMSGELLPGSMVDYDQDLSSEMIEYMKHYKHNKAGKRYYFDQRCYSLKSLVGKKPYRPPVPPAYGIPNYKSQLGITDDYGYPIPNNLVNVINRQYYDQKPYDAKLCIIAESGGKFRGICPYSSPYAHSINLYREARSVLLKMPGNCNYDQGRGHLMAKHLSRNNKSVVSSDASNFTDTINLEYASLMANALGSSGAVHYHADLRIMDFNGKIHTNCPPLMGWKGTFDLSSVLLAFSFNKHLGVDSKQRIQCGDDFLGITSLEKVRECYEFVGCQISESKTVVSKTVTIFCGEMFWNGLCITPVRFLMTDLNNTSRFIGKLISRTRDFIDRCNYSTSTRRTIFNFLKKRLGSRYKGFLDFNLSSKLGGIPLRMGPKLAFVPYLENNKKSLLCALCNIPIEKEEFYRATTQFSHLKLGAPYTIYGMGATLTPGSWPKKSKLVYGSRKKTINKMLSSNRAGISDVLLYLYDNTMLKA